MKMTLLEMVQDILDSMVSDKVNSISGDGSSEEATMVAGYIKTTYYELVARESWNFLTTVGVMDSVSDVARPNYLKSPVSVNQLRTVRYNVSEDAIPKMRVIEYLTPDEFVTQLYDTRPTDLSVTQIVSDFSGVKLPIRNDRFPKYYTSFDDTYLVFDAFHSSYDATLQSSKSMAMIVRQPDWTMEDDFIPDLPASMFPLLLAEAKDASFQYLRQTKTEKDSKRQYRHGSHQRHDEKRVRDKSPRKGFGRR